MTKPSVLLLVNRWYADGGVENFLEQLVDETSSHVSYAIMSLTTVVDSKAKCKKIGPVLGNGRIQDMFAHHAAIQKAMATGGYDVVHIQASNGSAFFLANLAEKAGISKRIIHSHNAGSETSGNPVKRWVGEFSSFLWGKAPTNLWACSTNAGEYLFKNKHFSIFMNGIDIDRFTFSPEDRTRIRSMLGVSDSEYLLGSIGRISIQKNPLFQLRVFSELRKLIPSSKFCMIGSGELESDVADEAERLHLGESLLRISRTSEPESFYSAFDALLFPPIFEGLSFVGIEAQCNGLPVYGSEALPTELGITELLNFKSLDEGAEEWAGTIADGIKRNVKIGRMRYSDILRAKGFGKEDCFIRIAAAYNKD